MPRSILTISFTTRKQKVLKCWELISKRLKDLHDYELYALKRFISRGLDQNDLQGKVCGIGCHFVVCALLYFRY